MLGPYPLGVMQGRLLPKYLGRYQAHPKGYWRDEFGVAAALEVDLIEFILDHEDAEENPLLADGGAAQILSASAETGTRVASICADNFMAAPVHDADPKRGAEAMNILDRLIRTAAALGVRDIVIPCVDNSSVKGNEAALDRLAGALGDIGPQAASAGVNLSLETDLGPGAFAALLDRVGLANVTVNYDTGNSAALGYDPREEFAAYGARISDIHLKDRTLGGGPVLLGTGDCDFATVFDLIARAGYRGPMIMQAWRDDEGVAVFRQQRDWLMKSFFSAEAMR